MHPYRFLHEPMKNKLIPVVSALFAACIGFAIGRNGTASPQPRANASEALNASNSSTTSRSRMDQDSNARSSSKGAHDTTGRDLAAMEPRAALQLAMSAGDPLDRMRQWLSYLDQLGTNDFPGVIAAFREGGVSEEHMAEYTMLLSAWAKLDPLGALQYASDNIKNPFAGQTILATWASKDPDSAIAWAKSHHTGDGANPWMVGVIKGMASSNLDRASTLLAEMPFSRERGDALDAVLPAYLQRSASAARQWIDGLSDDKLREGATMRLAGLTVNEDPTGTADWLLSHPSEATNRRIDDAMMAMWQKDPSSVATYYNQIPEGEARKNALRGWINGVGMEDPKAAVALMDRYKNDLSNRAVEQFVWHSMGKDPTVALNQVQRIDDENQRNQIYRRSLQYWLENNEGEALKWINSNPLPQNVIDHVNRLLDKNVTK